MNRLSQILKVTLVFSIVFVAAGCRYRQGPIGRAGVQPGRVSVPPPEPMTLPQPPGNDGWDVIGRPITDNDAQDGAGAREQSRRWEGMAVYFAYDRSTIGATERSKLDVLADYMKQNQTYIVIIEGHCDERGSVEYNRGLGERRALAVRDYLVNLGIAQTRLETLSFGKERPAVPNATSETDHAMNRRAEFVISVRR